MTASAKQADVTAAPDAASELDSAPVLDEVRKARFDRLVDDHYAFVGGALDVSACARPDLDDAAQEVFSRPRATSTRSWKSAATSSARAPSSRRPRVVPCAGDAR